MMDLQHKIDKKYIFIAIGVVLMVTMSGLLIFNTITLQTEQPKPFFKTLTNKIDKDFFNVFNKKSAPEKVTPSKVKINPKKSLVSKVATPEQIKIKQLFNTYKIIQTENNTIKQFIAQANQSSQIMTYKAFKKSKKSVLTEKKIADIKTGYKKLGISKTEATYPVDLRRTLTADRRIEAILIEDINSTLPGKITAQIENNIYAAQGRHILIPIGSKAIGHYQSLNKIGETRLGIIWSRIITPKGVNIVTNAEMTDQMGRSGLAGEIDTKFWDKYGLAILVSTVSALAQISVNVDNQNQAVFIDTYGKELSTLSAKILEEQINIKPTIKIPAGARILISATEDIWFPSAEGLIEIKPAKFQFLTAKK